MPRRRLCSGTATVRVAAARFATSSEATRVSFAMPEFMTLVPLVADDVQLGNILDRQVGDL